MPIAQPNTDAFFAELNAIRATGVVLTNRDKISHLERAIEAIKAPQNGQPTSMDATGKYYITLASLRCLTGDFQQAVILGEKGKKLTRDPSILLYHAITLSVAGFFSDAREWLDSIDDYDLTATAVAANLPAMLINCQSYGRMENAIDNIPKKFVKHVKALSDAKQILAELHISERQVLDILNFAGEMVRQKDTFLTRDLDMNAYLNDRYITISLPVHLSPSEVAAMEWEYTGEMLKKFPGFPFSSVSVGFSCSH